MPSELISGSFTATLFCNSALLAGNLAQDATAASAQDATSNGNVVTWRRPFQDKQNAQLRIESQLLSCLSHFVGIRTVSGDSQLHEEVFRGAKFLAGLLESVGMQVKLAQNVRTVHPCVLARLEVCPTRPTLVFYGHYDVQPAQELVRALHGQPVCMPRSGTCTCWHAFNHAVVLTRRLLHAGMDNESVHYDPEGWVPSRAWYLRQQGTDSGDAVCCEGAFRQTRGRGLCGPALQPLIHL